MFAVDPERDLDMYPECSVLPERREAFVKGADDSLPRSSSDGVSDLWRLWHWLLGAAGNVWVWEVTSR